MNATTPRWRKEKINLTAPINKIKLRACTHHGRKYAAGPCTIRLGSIDLGPSVALKAGREKRVLPPDDAVKWLLERKCPKWLAVALVKGED